MKFFWVLLIFSSSGFCNPLFGEINLFSKPEPIVNNSNMDIILDNALRPITIEEAKRIRISTAITNAQLSIYQMRNSEKWKGFTAQQALDALSGYRNQVFIPQFLYASGDFSDLA